jgi:[ribosomal protein S18]-alanine N-acetyltransferase
VPPAGERAVAPDHVIQPLSEADLDALMEIERLSFRAPWSRQVFQGELGRAGAYIDVLRAVPDGPVLAFSNYWRVVDELHLLKLATHPEGRRHGWGSRLLAHLLAVGRQVGCRLVTLEVRRSNEEAQRLYRRYGFRAVGLRPGYYADDGEDAVVMTLELRG